MNRPTDPPALLDAVITACVQAGEAILAIYDDAASLGTEAKADGSPLTRADLASHRILTSALADLTPDVPVLSEESTEIPYETRAEWKRFWLVDPLDGTKEFIKRNGEFTVNVALIEVRGGAGVPIAGVVHVPVSRTTYAGSEDRGAWREVDGTRAVISTSAPTHDTVRVVASRSHGNPATDAFIDGLATTFGTVERTSSGSSLKLCRVADGSAHYYPRVAPTMEWDTAAAHAIVTAAGGVVWRYGTTEPIRYAKRDLHNPSFLVAYANDAPLPDAYAASLPEENA